MPTNWPAAVQRWGSVADSDLSSHALCPEPLNQGNSSNADCNIARQMLNVQDVLLFVERQALGAVGTSTFRCCGNSLLDSIVFLWIHWLAQS